MKCFRCLDQDGTVQSQPYNLYTAHAAIEVACNTIPFSFPLGAVIAAHGYLVVFPSMFTDTLGTANLRLLIGGVTIDQISIPSLPFDQSYARFPDGSNSWHITNIPTIDSSNSTSLLNPVVSSSSTASSSNLSPRPGYATSTPAAIIGTQTVWNGPQFPTSVVMGTPVTKPSVAYVSASSSPVNGGWGTPQRILFTTLLVALALILFWCWKLFTSS